MFQSQARSGLDDKAKGAYVDDASGQPRAERLDDGLGGLARGAVADSDVRPAVRAPLCRQWWQLRAEPDDECQAWLTVTPRR